jgi:hypothetical protein
MPVISAMQITITVPDTSKTLALFEVFTVTPPFLQKFCLIYIENANLGLCDSINVIWCRSAHLPGRHLPEKRLLGFSQQGSFFFAIAHPRRIPDAAQRNPIATKPAPDGTAPDGAAPPALTTERRRACGFFFGCINASLMMAIAR